MLPDFRVVAIAVISTFLFAVFAGFYTSSRFANERKPRAESLAAIEESPLNRIALNWPKPVQPPSKSLDLDFAVTTKVLRNPVRDLSDEPVSAPAPEAKVAASPPVVVPHRSLESPAPRADAPAVEAVRSEPAKIAAPAEIPAPIEAPKTTDAKPAIVQTETRVIETVPGAATPAPIAAPVVAPQAIPEPDVPTASIVAAPRADLPTAAQKEEAATQTPAAQVASRPHPAAPEADPEPESATSPTAEITLIDAKPVAKKVARKKKAAKKVAKPSPRARPPT